MIKGRIAIPSVDPKTWRSRGRKKRKQPTAAPAVVTPAPMKKRLKGPVVRLGAEVGADDPTPPSRSAVVEPKQKPKTTTICGGPKGGCQHAGAADLQAIIDAGQGDKPVKELKFRCPKCGSRLTDFVVMSRDAQRVRPWRSDDTESTSSAAGHLRGQRPWRADGLSATLPEPRL